MTMRVCLVGEKLLLRTTDKRLKKKYSDKQSDMLSLLSAIELELNKEV